MSDVEPAHILPRHTDGHTSHPHRQALTIDYVLEAATVVFLSLWKTYLPPIVGVGLSMSYPEAVGFTMTGALLSIGCSLYLARPVTAIFKHCARKLRGPGHSTPRFHPRLRKVLRVYRKYGFWGLMALTPVLVGLPIGIWVAVRLGSRRGKVAVVCATSCLIWSSLSYLVAIHGADWIVS